MDTVVVSLAVFLPVCLTALCGVVLLVVAGYFLLRVFARWPVALPVGGEEFLVQVGGRLLPWRGDALADLAAHWRGNWRLVTGAGIRGQFQGVVKSLGQPEAEGWLAFHLDRPEAKRARLVMRTSGKEFTFDVRLEAAFPMRGEVDILLDGRPFGRIHLPDGDLLDAEGRAIGHYRRPRLTVHTVGMVPQSYTPIVIGERTIAELTCLWMRLPGRFKGRFYYSFTPLPTPWPALRNIASEISPEEENWLLSLVGLELFYDTAWSRRSW